MADEGYQLIDCPVTRNVNVLVEVKMNFSHVTQRPYHFSKSQTLNLNFIFYFLS